jgi:uncharacterized protein
VKASKYNMFWNLEDGTKIAFNSLTCALAEINSDFLEIIDNIDSIQLENLEPEKKKLIDDMFLGNFICDDNFDEVKILKWRHYAGKFDNSGSLELVLAPTLHCNFNCPYCYESDTTKHGNMGQEVQQAIINYVIENAKNKKDINITWYGGEPTLAKELIYDMSAKMIAICEENNVQYKAFMVTNGYLINDDDILKFKESKINGAQITLDGPPEINNKRRKLKESNEDTFYTILNNTKKFTENGIRVGIRVNIDKSNIDYVEELIDRLSAEGLTNKIDVSFGQVDTYTQTTCASFGGCCLDKEEYANIYLSFQKMLHDKGFSNAKGYTYYPGLKANYCCADSSASFVVDPQGYMYKCWNDVGIIERAVGNVTYINKPNHNMMMQNADYLLWSPFNFSECVECNVLPICMGGCPHNGRADKKPECEKWKYNLEDVLKYTYFCKKELKEEECPATQCSCS